MTTIAAPSMTKHITTPQYDDTAPNHMPKHNMPRRTICPNIICYNQILIVSFHVDPPQYGQTYSYYSLCNIPNHLIIYFYFNPTAPNLMPLLFTIQFHKLHTSLVRSHSSCHVSDSTFLAVSHLYSCLSPGRIHHN